MIGVDHLIEEKAHSGTVPQVPQFRIVSDIEGSPIG